MGKQTEQQWYEAKYVPGTKRYGKLYMFTSAKRLVCDMCEKVIQPFDQAYEGEEEGLFHEDCLIQRYFGLNHMYLYGWGQGLKCKACGGDILMLTAWDMFTGYCFHEDCLPEPGSELDEQRAIRPDGSVADPELEEQDKQTHVEQPQEEEPESQQEEEYNEDEGEIPEGRYTLDGWLIQIRKQSFGQLKGKRILSVSEDLKDQRPAGIAFVSGIHLFVWKKQKGQYPGGEKAAKALLKIFDKDKNIKAYLIK